MIIEYEVNETQGAAALAANFRLVGYLVVKVERKGTKAVITYRKM